MKVILQSIFVIPILFFQQKSIAQQHHVYDYIITNVTVIDAVGEKAEMPGMDVFVDNGKIVKIIPAEKNHDFYLTLLINGTGKYLSPGLADMHAHLHKENIERYFLLNIAAGVTTLRSMRGDSSHLGLRDKILYGNMPGPTLFLSPDPFLPKTPIKKEDLPKVIAAWKAQGYDFVKILAIPDSAYYEAVMDASNKNGLMVAGHWPRPVSLEKVIDDGFSSIEHLYGFMVPYEKDSNRFKALVKKTKDKKMYNCATMDYYVINFPYPQKEILIKRSGVELMDTATINGWHREIDGILKVRDTMNKDSLKVKDENSFASLVNRRKALKELADAGCLLLVSPATEDIYSVPGFDMYAELEIHKQAGISDKEILKAATYNAALYFKQENEWGRIAEGQRADMILTDKNPLENISNVKYPSVVFVNGTYYDAVELRKKLAPK